MRPIKFRAWDGKKMVYGVLAGSNTECPNVCDYDEDSVWWWHEPPEAIMQFTGLYDKSGKEVWEGDIVKWLSHEARDGKQLRPERILVVGNDWIFDCYALRNIMEGNGTAEVIGNRYQNPELLEEK